MIAKPVPSNGLRAATERKHKREAKMKRAPWLGILWALAYALVLAQLSGCGQASDLDPGQATPPAPTAMGTTWPFLPQPVISVFPPANSATAVIQATAVAQRSATALAYSARTAATAIAIGELAPTYTAQAATREAALHPTPQSARVERGKAYPFVLYTHCGVDFNTDFDGSFWDASEQNYAPRSLGNSSQNGTMTLVDDNHVRFEFEGGTILFTRHLGPKVLPGFCF